jgi:Flp pilus assembly pilin Flp
MLNLYFRIRNWLQREEGQDMIEYVLLVVLIALIVAAFIPPVTTAISGAFTAVSAWLGGAAGP